MHKKKQRCKIFIILSPEPSVYYNNGRRNHENASYEAGHIPYYSALPEGDKGLIVSYLSTK